MFVYNLATKVGMFGQSFAGFFKILWKDIDNPI